MARHIKTAIASVRMVFDHKETHCWFFRMMTSITVLFKGYCTIKITSMDQNMRYFKQFFVDKFPNRSVSNHILYSFLWSKDIILCNFIYHILRFVDIFFIQFFNVTSESLDLLNFKRELQLFLSYIHQLYWNSGKVTSMTIAIFHKWINQNECSTCNVTMNLKKFQWNHHWIFWNVIPRSKTKKLIRSKKNLVFSSTLRWTKSVLF